MKWFIYFSSKGGSQKPKFYIIWISIHTSKANHFCYNSSEFYKKYQLLEKITKL